MAEAVIVEAVRSPVGKRNGGLSGVHPADLSAQQATAVQGLAAAAFQTLGCEGMARVDFFLDRGSGAFYFNEVNTIPGFTSISMYPKMWEAAGLPYAQLVDRLIELAIERHRAKQATRFTR